MAKKYRFALLHLAFFFGGLISGSTLLFLALSALCGFFPRIKQGFGYYLLLAVLALVLVYFLNPPEAALLTRLEELLGLEAIPFSAVVGMVTALTMVFTALALNRLVLPKNRSSSRR